MTLNTEDLIDSLGEIHDHPRYCMVGQGILHQPCNCHIGKLKDWVKEVHNLLSDHGLVSELVIDEHV